MRPALALAAVAGLLPAALAAQGAVLIGSVVDTVGRPLEGAEVVALVRRRSTRTGSDGRFRLGDLEPGPEIFLVRAIGYRLLRQSAGLVADDTVEIAVTMAPMAQLLPDIVVEATGKHYPARLAEMVQRMRMAPRSNFIERSEIERWGAFDLSNVFRRAGLTVRGDKLVCPRGGGFGRTAQITVYMDGGYFAEGSDFDTRAFPSSWLEAIEVYRGAAEIPIEYNRTGSSCVVLLWSR